MINLTYSNLEAQTGWIQQIGEDINEQPPEAMCFSVLPDGSRRMTNMSTVQYGGGMYALKLAPAGLQQLAYASLSFQMFITAADLVFLNAAESDIKLCFTGAPANGTLANIINGSAQLNIEEGGMWQIAIAGGGWIDSGFKPGLPAADTWVSVAIKIAFTATTWGVYWISQGGLTFTVPPALQNIPYDTSNWQPVMAVQLQNEVSQPGSTAIRYRQITLILSDTKL